MTGLTIHIYTFASSVSLVSVTNVTWRNSLSKLLSLSFSGRKKKRNQWTSTVLAHSLSKPLATGKNASKLCSPKGRQLLNIVKGLFLSAGNQWQAPTQPKGISKCDNAKTSAAARLFSRTTSDAYGRFIYSRWQKGAKNNVRLWPCVIQLRNIYLDLGELFVLWKSACPCQKAFKWKSVRDGANEVKGQLKGGEGRWPGVVPQREQILQPAWASRSEMSFSILPKFRKSLMWKIRRQKTNFWLFILFKHNFSWDKYSLMRSKICCHCLHLSTCWFGELRLGEDLMINFIFYKYFDKLFLCFTIRSSFLPLSEWEMEGHFVHMRFSSLGSCWQPTKPLHQQQIPQKNPTAIKE